GGEQLGGAGNSTGDPIYGMGWCEGWLDWKTTQDNVNVDYLITDQYAKLGAYVSRNRKIFKCPADHFLATIQAAIGWKERVRSLSGNIGLGADNADAPGAP